MLSTPVPSAWIHFSFLALAHHLVGHGRGEAQQDVGVGDIGLDLAVVADHVDGERGEALEQHGLVTGPHGFLDFGEDE